MIIEVTGRQYISKIEFCCPIMSETFLDDDVSFGEVSLSETIFSEKNDRLFNFCPFCGCNVQVIRNNK